MAEPTTKICDSCDAEVGIIEKKCPKCSIDFEELEEAVTAVSKAQEVLEKRRKKKEQEAAPPPTPPPAKKKSPFGGLANALRKK
jgi:phage FluMu protein Com